MNNRMRVYIVVLAVALAVVGASVVWYAAQARQTISEYRPGPDPEPPQPPPYSELPPSTGAAP